MTVSVDPFRRPPMIAISWGERERWWARTTRRLDERARWRRAETLGELGELVAQFVEGKLDRTPGHWGPREDETVEIAGPLAHANRQGFVTVNSQPGYDRDERGNEQRAEVDGWASPETVAKLRRLFAGTPIEVRVTTERPLRTDYSDIVNVSRTVGPDGVWGRTHVGHVPGRFAPFINFNRPDLTEDAHYVTIYDPEWGDRSLLWDRLAEPDWDHPTPPKPESSMPRHIPVGREDSWRRQAESDAAVQHADKAADATEKRRDDLVKALGWDDPLVDEADAELGERLDEHRRTVAVNNRIYEERTAGLSWGIDHDPTAPICAGCNGVGCKTCRGWGREYREPIPVWNERDREWVNPATGRTVDLFAEPAEPYKPPRKPPDDIHDLRRGRWYDENPIRENASTGGGAVANIEEVRAGIMAAVEKMNEGLGAIQHGHASLEEAQGQLMAATEGSGQGDVSTANGLLAQAVNSSEEVSQQVAAAMSEAEGVANRL